MILRKYVPVSSFVTILLFSSYAQEAVIADHAIIAEYDKIPVRWIDSVKTMLLSFPGASHGAAFMYGIELLAAQDTRFPATVVWEGQSNVPEAPANSHLRVFRPVRNFANNGWVDRGGEEHFWTSEAARTAMKNHLTYFKATLNNPISAFTYAWSYEVSNGTLSGGWAGDLVIQGGANVSPWNISTTTPNLNTYLAAVTEYNAHEPSCRTFFLTGPVDGAYFADERGYQAFQKYEAMRNYARAHGGAVLDYADILSWNDAGQQKTSSWNNVTYGYIHRDNEGSYSSDGHLNCHISQAGCLRLGKAIWWMLARIKGWNGGAASTTSTPVISPASGTFQDSVRVAISCATQGAVVHYTINGTEPLESSPSYTASFRVTANTTVRAKAWSSGLSASGIASAVYTITKIQTVATPVLAPVGDTYHDSVSVTVSCATTGATVRFTTNGADPTNLSELFSAPIKIYQTTTVKARAWASGMNSSAIEAAHYVISKTPKAPAPVFSPAAGTYDDSVRVVLSSSTSNAAIRYTTDSSTPSANAALYSKPVIITKTSTIKAVAFVPNMNPSDVASAHYAVTHVTKTGSTGPNKPTLQLSCGNGALEVLYPNGRRIRLNNARDIDKYQPAHQSGLSIGVYFIRVQDRTKRQQYKKIVILR